MSPSDLFSKSRCIIILLVLATAGSFAVWFLNKSDISPGNIRNVLLISIDTCRADRLSCYGYKAETTPNIDALAEQGILFENVISPVPITLPAHSSMLTGTIPPYHGVHDNGGYLLDKPNITLAEILKDAGFITAAAVSAFVLDSQFGIDQGFDTYLDRFDAPLEGQPFDQRRAGETTRVALDWLEENKDEKFFFFLHYFDPHAKYEPPEPFASTFGANSYEGEIAYTDHYIGQVVGKLKELGLYDSTLIIITADHGELLGEHGERTHAYFIYQGAIKVPLIFKVPGQNTPQKIKPIAGLIDIVPTVCSLLGIETPKSVQGIDLSPSFNGQASQAPDRYLYCESLWATRYGANPLLGIANDRFKYIQTTRPELYDLIEDPAEFENLVEELPQQTRIMKDRLEQILLQSVRKDSQDSKIQVDAQAIERLESLGYAGGTVDEDFRFDQTKDDPKDLLKYHALRIQIVNYSASKEYDKVKMYAKRMIQQRPDCYIGYEQLGFLALREKDYAKAIDYFQKVIDIEPNHANAYNARGLAYLDKADYDRAARDFSKAIELNPMVAETHMNMGRALLRQNKTTEAIKYYRQALQLRNDWPNLLNNFAWILATHQDDRIRNGAEAVRLAKRACQLDSYRVPAALDTLAAAYAETGQFDLAVKTAQNALQLARDAGQTELLKDIQSHRDFYRAKRPWRGPSANNAPASQELRE